MLLLLLLLYCTCKNVSINYFHGPVNIMMKSCSQLFLGIILIQIDVLVLRCLCNMSLVLHTKEVALFPCSVIFTCKFM